MARNIERYGYAPNKRHNLTVLEIQHRRRQGLHTRPKRRRTPDEQRQAIAIMSTGARADAYDQQYPRRANFTRRQHRRINHKAWKAPLR